MDGIKFNPAGYLKRLEQPPPVPPSSPLIESRRIAIGNFYKNTNNHIAKIKSIHLKSAK